MEGLEVTQKKSFADKFKNNLYELKVSLVNHKLLYILIFLSI